MIRIEGRNLADEGFGGANARDMSTGRMSSEAASMLTGMIKKAVQPISFAKPSSNKASVGNTSIDLMKRIEENTIAAQEFFTENTESTEEFKTLIKMMSAAVEKTGDASVKAIEEAIKQIEKVKLSSSDPVKANEVLGLDTAKETLSNTLRPQSIGGRVFQKLTNVDLRKEKAYQAFTAEKLFGMAPSKRKQQETLDRVAKEEFDIKNKGSATLDIVENLTSENNQEKSPTEKNAQGGEVFKAGIDRESLDSKKVGLLEQILKELKEIGDSLENNMGGLPDMPNFRGPRAPVAQRASRTGPSRTVKPKVTDLLDKNGKPLRGAARQARLDKLAKTGTNVADDVARAGTNVADDVARAGTNVADDVVRGASTTSKVLNGTGKLLSKAAIPLAVGMGAYEGYTDYKEADQLVESGAINEETGQAFTEQDETAGKVEAVTEAAGGTAGAIAGGTVGATYGATAGAAIGSLFFGVGAAPGAAIGGFLGGAIGGTLGYFGGSAAGEAIGDAATTTSGEAALEAAEESGLYNKNWVGKSKINPEMLKETTDTAQLNAILADDDLSEKDTNRVLERLSEIDSGDSTASISAPSGEMSIMDGYVPNPTSLPDISTSQVPTGEAVNNMTEAASPTAESKAPTIINNVTNNNTTGSQSSPVMVAPSSSRNKTNSFIDFQHKQYTRI